MSLIPVSSRVCMALSSSCLGALPSTTSAIAVFSRNFSTHRNSSVFKTSGGVLDRGIGIVAMEVYFPANYVSQEALERFDGVSKGKYVVGLGQNNMAVADEREDINSICMTAVQNLLEKYDISPSKIGRVEVGTETLIDKSKSVKTELMRLFSPSGNTDIEGCDTINACYGGTSAFFNACNWMSSPDWELDGRYALVVSGDIAVYEKGPARPTGGCGAVALLIGPNAPLRLEHGLKASHSESAYDFYKPRLDSEFPIVDGKLSNRCYLRAIDLCYQRLLKKIGKRDGEEKAKLGLDYFESFAFHSPYNKLIQKSFGRLALNDYYTKHSSAVPLTEDKKAVLERFRDVKVREEEGYESKDLDKVVIDLSRSQYERMVAPTTSLAKEIGNTYTASLWGSLVSLVANKGDGLAGGRVGMFSYGSGLCSSMFVLSGPSVDNQDGRMKLEGMRNKLDLFQRLKNRREVTPQEFTDILERRTKHYGTNVIPTTTTTGASPSLSVTPKAPASIPTLSPGTFYLTEIDKLWRRSYARSSEPVSSSTPSPFSFPSNLETSSQSIAAAQL